MQKRSNIIKYQNTICKILANSVAMITKPQIRFNYVKEISVKMTQKRANIIRYQKNYCNLLANALAMIRK